MSKLPKGRFHNTLDTVPPKHKPRNSLSIPRPAPRSARTGNLSTKVLVWLLGTGVGLVTAYFALFPYPSLERDVSLDDKNPYRTQFTVTNASPWFSMYRVRTSCAADWKDSNNNIFDNNQMQGDTGQHSTQDKLAPGSKTTIACPMLSNDNNRAMFSFPGYDLNTLISVSVELAVSYDWIWHGSFMKRQRLEGIKNSKGEFVWTYAR